MAVGPNQTGTRSTQSNQAKTSPQHLPLTTYFPTSRQAVEYIMETFPIVKRKDEKEYGEYRTKLRILEIYDAMTPLFESIDHPSLTTYHSPLDPPPGSPCDEDGNFISMEQWDKDKWPKHIHKND